MSQEETPGPDFYRTFSEKRLTRSGEARRDRIERTRLGQVMRFRQPPGKLLEIGPGQGGIARLAKDAGWAYTAVEPSPILADQLRTSGFDVIESWTPPIPSADASQDVIYLDQVLEHMSGIDAARALVAEALSRASPGGPSLIVVPDYLKERGFFWDIDYTHNFVTTERRVRQLLYDGGFEIRSSGPQHRSRRPVRRAICCAADLARRQPARPRCALALHADAKSCCSKCARICSKRSPSSPAASG